eukprot:CAMPEP_0198296698 /NCGR_PEP_ID=MMETSP1449-20131203/33577_1 /TAXON_ID=420275 /ORGANISM="Attheya septentrionalis, Strain CCMP2084" /LENGTH=145 /DNA_ID=CAMNT_0043997379 /DNA_START=60 /DNA_END=498 /DNA_ORIENTATION=-
MLVCEIEWVCVELFWFYLDNGFDFDGHVEGEGIGSNGTSGMVSDGFSKDFHNDVGTSVHDQVLTLEVGGGVDNAKYFDDLFDAVEVTEVFLESGNDAEATETGGLISFVNIASLTTPVMSVPSSTRNGKCPEIYNMFPDARHTML